MPGCDSSNRRSICGCCQRRGHYCSAKAQTDTKPIAQLQRITLRTNWCSFIQASICPIFPSWCCIPYASLVIGPFGHADIAQWSCHLVKRCPLASKWWRDHQQISGLKWLRKCCWFTMIYISCVIWGFIVYICKLRFWVIRPCLEFKLVKCVEYERCGHQAMELRIVKLLLANGLVYHYIMYFVCLSFFSIHDIEYIDRSCTLFMYIYSTCNWNLDLFVLNFRDETRKNSILVERCAVPNRRLQVCLPFRPR